MILKCYMRQNCEGVFFSLSVQLIELGGQHLWYVVATFQQSCENCFLEETSKIGFLDQNRRLEKFPLAEKD